MRINDFVKIAMPGCVALALFGCGRSHENGRHYEVRGVIRGISPDRTTLEIQHQNIPDFMPSMTMPFLARDQKEIANLKLGDAISFRMTVTKNDFWIDKVTKVRREDVDVAEPKPTSAASPQGFGRLKEGDAMPLFNLTNQNGEPISLDTFRGRPFVLTFVFTRCPLPNFCPRMSHNFAELQDAIKATPGRVVNPRLLSITIDPAFDTPKILAAYGESLKTDPEIWTFATGEPKEIDALTQEFSVYRQTEGGTISHGLATALINRDGKIEKIWRGNAWTPSEILAAIRAESQ